MSDNDDDVALFGKRFDDISEKDGVSKKPLSLENQVVTDDKGRRRFHGAFTGGFSAGYFNTVGTVEGWTPSTFKSGRSARAEKLSKRPEDFMDEEDLGEYGIAPRSIQTTKTFKDEQESVSKDNQRKHRLAWDHTELAQEADRLSELIKPANDSVGAALMMKMGWRQGKGVGPAISRKTKTDEFAPPNFQFAPDDVDFHVFESKSDFHGLGYVSLASSSLQRQDELFKQTAVTSNKKQRKGIRGQAFGVGAFEEDDEDIYSVDNLSKYDFTLDSGFDSPKVAASGKVDDDFVPATNQLSSRKFFQPPKLARDFVPKCPFAGENLTASTSRLPSTALKGTTQPAHRGALLGVESPTVWSLVSSSDRRRLGDVAKASTAAVGRRRSRFDVPPSGPAAGAERRREKPDDVVKSRHDDVTRYDDVIGLDDKLSGGSVGVKGERSAVFRSDPSKQERFDMFICCLKRGFHMPKPAELTDWEWEEERREFMDNLPVDLSATLETLQLPSTVPLCPPSVSQPALRMIKSRFTAAKFDEDAEKQVQEDHDKVKAVQMKMFGKLTHEKHEWHPHKTLCKRFNVPVPYPDSSLCGVPHLKKDVDKSKSDIFGSIFTSTADDLESRKMRAELSSHAPTTDGKSAQEALKSPETDNLRVEKSGEPARPAMDIFEAIFAETSESSSDDETAPIEGPVSKPETSPKIFETREKDVSKNFSTSANQQSKILRKPETESTIVGLKFEESTYGPILPPSDPANISGRSNAKPTECNVKKHSSKHDRHKLKKHHRRHSGANKKSKRRSRDKRKSLSSSSLSDSSSSWASR